MDRTDTEIPGGNDSDEYLIKEFQKGNSDVFDRLILKYKDKVFNICYRFLGHYDEANDSAQETFLKAYRYLNGFKFKSSFYTWLYTIAINTCKNAVKSAEYKKKKKTMSINNESETEDGHFTIELKGNGNTPSLELEKKERELYIQQNIDSLKEEHKTIIIFRDIEGLTYEEISKMMKLNIGTVKSKLSRAREILKTKLISGGLFN